MILLLSAAVLLPGLGRAQDKKGNPASKVYVSDVSGEAQIDTGENIQELNKRNVYKAEGTVIETKKAERDSDKNKVYSTMVYSNGTGAYFDQDTRVEVKRFVQEPFTPNRTDMEVEPSISQTQAFLARGTVALCNSKLVAGSRMTYATPFGEVNIRGQKVVIETRDDETKISMLEGESTVRTGATEIGGQVLRAGEQAIIRRPREIGAPPQIQITRIPPQEAPDLDDKVALACMAKKTVYFEVKERQTGTGEAAGATADATDSGSGGGAAIPGPVTAFDGNNSPGATSSTTRTEIIAVPVVPTELPVKFTVSPARIVGSGGGGGG
jgi:hypothetical protein